MAQDLSVPRRSMDIEDYIDIVRRHKAWIFGPTFAALVISVVVAFLWPDTYYSSAIIRIVPSQVPEAYIPPNITTDMQGRINGLTQLILNRAALTGLINKHQLYRKELTRLPTDDVVEYMKNHDISIGSVQTFAQANNGRQVVPAFVIGFKYNNRMIAQKVTTDLVSSFIDESMKESEGQSRSTTDLLEQQLSDAKKKLDAADKQLQDFSIRNAGHLPTQEQANYSQITAVQAQMLSVESQMSRVQQDRLQIDNEMRIAKQQLSQLKDPNADLQIATEQKNDKLAAKDKEIEQAESYLERLRERYKDSHPDVQNAISQINVLKKQREEIAKEDANKKPEERRPLPPNPVFVREQRNLQANIQRLAGLQEARDLEMQQLKRESDQLTQQLNMFKSRMDAAPMSQGEYSELVTNREIALKQYQEAETKYNMSKQAEQVEHRNQAEKLSILDPPNLPQTPTEPKRPIIVAIGTGIGLVLGFVLAAAREVKNTSLKNLKDVRAYTQLQVLGSIPLLENDLVVRRRRRLGWLAWSTACLVGIAIMASSVVYYYQTKV